MRKVTLRLSEEEWKVLRRLSEASSRSMNGQVIRLIKDAAAKKGIIETGRPRLVKTS